MTTTAAGNKGNRWHKRCAWRLSLILAALSCVYFACWNLTRHAGIPDVMAHVNPSEFGVGEVHGGSNPACPLPFVVGVDIQMIYWPAPTEEYRHYYFWFFGYTFKLPYERDL